jgi:hypothetical protein
MPLEMEMVELVVHRVKADIEVAEMEPLEL